MSGKLLESGEMYLETILVLSKTKDLVRAIDIVEYMGFSKPSVSIAMSKLKEGGYILINPDGHISLTSDGLSLAEKIYDRHTTLTDFLVQLGVDKDTAAADACKIEHDISDESFEAIKKHATDIRKHRKQAQI